MEPDLHDLLLAWNGGDVDADRRAALLARLRADAAFRGAFSEELRMLGMLKAAQSAEPRWLRIEDELGAKEEEEPWDEDAFSGSVMSELSRTERGGFLRRNRWLIAAAVLVLAGLGSFWAMRLRSDRGEAMALLDKAGDERGFAIVSHLEGTAVGPHGRPVREGDVISAGSFRMPAGAATLRFFDGAVLYVEGSADLDLLALDRVFCHRGRLRVRMEEGASGFTVTGPGMAVVDLGTEFAMNVAADGVAALHIFEGKVEASVLNREGDTLRSELLQKDESASIEPGSGRISRTAQPAAAFASARVAPTPELRLDRAYAAAVLESKPWGYWRFGSLENDRTPNEIQGGPSLRAVGAPRLNEEPGGNRTLVFPPETVGEQYLLMDGLWQQPVKAGYAVELWMMPAAMRESALVSLIDASQEGAPEKHYFLLQLMDHSQRWLHPNGSVRFLHRSPPGVGGGVNAFAQRAYLPGVWQHVFAQNSGDRMELYLDGRLVGHAPVDPDQAPGLYRLLVGRLKQTSHGDAGGARPFVGSIGELAFYEHTLSPAEIARHCALGNSKPAASLQK